MCVHSSEMKTKGKGATINCKEPQVFKSNKNTILLARFIKASLGKAVLTFFVFFLSLSIFFPLKLKLTAKQNLWLDWKEHYSFPGSDLIS